MAPTSAAERQRQCLARHNADPVKREQYLERERDGKGMLIQGEKEKISDLLNEREQHQKCKQWRTAYKRSKERNGALRNLTIN